MLYRDNIINKIAINLYLYIYIYICVDFNLFISFLFHLSIFISQSQYYYIKHYLFVQRHVTCEVGLSEKNNIITPMSVINITRVSINCSI